MGGIIRDWKPEGQVGEDLTFCAEEKGRKAPFLLCAQGKGIG
jgi:hypothetical protein